MSSNIAHALLLIPLNHHPSHSMISVPLSVLPSFQVSALTHQLFIDAETVTCTLTESLKMNSVDC